MSCTGSEFQIPGEVNEARDHSPDNRNFRSFSIPRAPIGDRVSECVSDAGFRWTTPTLFLENIGGRPLKDMRHLLKHPLRFFSSFQQSTGIEGTVRKRCLGGMIHHSQFPFIRQRHLGLISDYSICRQFPITWTTWTRIYLSTPTENKIRWEFCFCFQSDIYPYYGNLRLTLSEHSVSFSIDHSANLRSHIVRCWWVQLRYRQHHWRSFNW